MPALVARPPSEWTLSSGPLIEADLRERLQNELKASFAARGGRDAILTANVGRASGRSRGGGAGAFGSASDFAAGMSVEHDSNGVTHEMLTDDAFLASAAKAVPGVRRFHEELDAVRS